MNQSIMYNQESANNENPSNPKEQFQTNYFLQVS